MNNKNYDNIKAYIKHKKTESLMDNNIIKLTPRLKRILSIKFKGIVEFSFMFNYINITEYNNLIMKLDSFINN